MNTLFSPIIKDEGVQRLVDDLSSEFGWNKPLDVRQSSMLNSAAAIAWPTPSIMLPVGWNEWSAIELRAVLAHELAHVVRRDFGWRMIASLGQSLHFYHPLVHLLSRRLALLQELSADRLAAAAVGSRDNYLRALSQLAIRHDVHTSQLTPYELPVFSGFLIRRIEMLRSKDCTHVGQGSRKLHVALFSAVLAGGLFVIGLRAFAQVPNEDAAPRVARSTKSDSQGRVPPSRALFSERPLDVSVVGENPHGMFVARLGQLVDHKEIRSIIDDCQPALDSVWKEIYSTDVAPKLDLSSIDYVAAQARMESSPVKDPQPDGPKNTVSFGTDLCVVRFREKVNLQPWIEKYIPQAEEKRTTEGVFYELPLVPMLGPHRVLVAVRDDRTVCITFDEKRLFGDRASSRESDEKGDEAISRWASGWPRIDGGMIAMMVSDDKWNIEPSEDTEAATAISQIFDGSDTLGLRLDLSRGSDRLGVRLQFGCTDREKAVGVRDAFQSLLSIARLEYQKAVSDASGKSPIDDVEIRLLKQMVKLLDGVKLSVSANADETADVRVEYVGSNSLGELTELIQLISEAL